VTSNCKSRAERRLAVDIGGAETPGGRQALAVLVAVTTTARIVPTVNVGTVTLPLTIWTSVIEANPFAAWIVTTHESHELGS
jgi:hypothetical protein